MQMIVLSRPTTFPHPTHQWHRLANVIGQHKAVRIINPEPTSEDSVFCRDAYAKIGSSYIVARFHKNSRKKEASQVVDQLSLTSPLKPPWWTTFEGGDIRKVNDTKIICGFGKRTSLGFVYWLRRTLPIDVTAVRLVDSRTFHLDLCLCVFGESALIVGNAFSSSSLQSLTRMFPDHLLVDMEDRYACNGLKIRSTYIVSHMTHLIRSWLQKRGVSVLLVDCSEFHREDGGVHCLTNEL
jgi:N-dimethylarginine dimethylaminohydrolase